MRYSGVLLSGFLGGMGGAVFAQSIAGRFGITTIAGQGFISMAAMIFGKWNPLGAMGAALFFGFAQNLSIAGENLPIISEIPKVYLQAAPYVLTILVLVVFFGKSSGPKANGKNYVKRNKKEIGPPSKRRGHFFLDNQLNTSDIRHCFTAKSELIKET